MKTSMRSRLLSGALLAAACIPLAGCGTWSLDDLEGTPPPPTQNDEDPPAQNEDNPPQGDVATIGDVGMPSAGSNTNAVVWSPDLGSEEEPDVDTTLNFRLVQSSRSISIGTPSSTSKDEATDADGATLTFFSPADPDAEPTVSLTLGNDALGVKDVELEETVPGVPFVEATLGDGRIVRVVLQAEDKTSTSDGEELNWTAYGSWNIRSASNVPQNGAVFVTGVETPDTGMPTTGSATFDGFVEGAVALPEGGDIRTANLRGDATITADFANGTISGAAPNITATPFGVTTSGGPVTPGPQQAWNGLAFESTFTSGLNGFSGTTGVSSAPGNSYSLASDAAGHFAGMFYGPAADELGAVWNLHDGVGTASGVLVGGR